MESIKWREVAWWIVAAAAIAFFVNSPRIFSWLSEQDKTVQAAIYAPAIALLGVIVNTLASGWNTGRQLEQARAQDDRKTALELKREVFLGVADHIDDALETIVNFADPGLDHKDVVERLQRNSHFLARLQLVGSIELNRDVAVVDAEISLGIAKVRIAREALDRQLNKLRAVQAGIDGHETRAAAAEKLFRDRGLAGTLDQPSIARLEGIAKSEREAIEMLRTMQTGLVEAVRQERWSLHKIALDERSRVQAVLGAAVGRARTELGSPTDSDAYGKVVAELAPTRQAQRAELERLFIGRSAKANDRREKGGEGEQQP